MPSEDELHNLINSINNEIKNIESDINREQVNSNTIEIYKSLNEYKNSFFNLKLDNPNYKNNKKEFGYKILRLKKELISYYNKKLLIINVRLNNIIDKLKYQNDLILLDTLRSIKLPSSHETITNFQKNINILDFKKIFDIEKYITNIETKHNITWNDDSTFELNYINNYELPRIEKDINKYLNKERGISKQSILIDIELCKLQVRDIEKKYNIDKVVYKECFRFNDILDEFENRLLVNKNKINDYQILKERILLLNQELKDYSSNINLDNQDINSINNDLIKYKNKYNSLHIEIDLKYQNNNKQLYSNLLNQLNITSNIINDIENKITNKDNNKIETKEETIYKIETIEDANDFYKKYQKPILLASGIASMALLNARVGPILVPTIIFANVVLANKYKVVDSINNILAKSIDASIDEFGNYIKNNKIKISFEDAISGLLKSVASLKNKSSNTISELMTRIKKSSIIIKTNEHINNIKDRYNTRKSEVLDLKTTKLYYEFILSGKSLEDFCKDRELSNEVFNNLVDFMKYKEDKGRSK